MFTRNFKKIVLGDALGTFGSASADDDASFDESFDDDPLMDVKAAVKNFASQGLPANDQFESKTNRLAYDNGNIDNFDGSLESDNLVSNTDENFNEIDETEEDFDHEESLSEHFHEGLNHAMDYVKRGFLSHTMQGQINLNPRFSTKFRPNSCLNFYALPKIQKKIAQGCLCHKLPEMADVTWQATAAKALDSGAEHVEEKLKI